MAKPDATALPELKAAWDAYGHAISWDKLFDMKMDRGCYVVLAWKTPDGMVEVADMARGGHDKPWEMQNDGFNPMSEADWKKLKIVPECDWFVVKGNPDFQGF